MEVKINQVEKVITAQFIGRLDTPASLEVSRQVQPLIDHADLTVVLDCSQMEYISSSGLRIFLTIRKAASARGGRVIIRNMNEDIRKVFMMTGFLNLFEVEKA
ncbi:MAG: STAS domain-containing protein [Bacteroidales bacterium]|nr:STAS domain-containing protein [Bacteroidales bacterium]